MLEWKIFTQKSLSLFKTNLPMSIIVICLLSALILKVTIYLLLVMSYYLILKNIPLERRYTDLSQILFLFIPLLNIFILKSMIINVSYSIQSEIKAHGKKNDIDVGYSSTIGKYYHYSIFAMLIAGFLRDPSVILFTFILSLILSVLYVVRLNRFRILLDKFPNTNVDDEILDS